MATNDLAPSNTRMCMPSSDLLWTGTLPVPSLPHPKYLTKGSGTGTRTAKQIVGSKPKQSRPSSQRTHPQRPVRNPCMRLHLGQKQLRSCTRHYFLGGFGLSSSIQEREKGRYNVLLCLNYY